MTPPTSGSATKGLKHTGRQADREGGGGAVVHDHQPAHPWCFLCRAEAEAKDEPVGRPTRPGRSAIGPSAVVARARCHALKMHASVPSQGATLPCGTKVGEAHLSRSTLRSLN